jgi:rubredoxin
MPHRLCPICPVQGRLLEHTSKDAMVEYYRCDKCGHVWTHEKGDPNSPATNVTVRSKPKASYVTPARVGASNDEVFVPSQASKPLDF